MKQEFGTFPLLIKISGLVVGVPLLLLGLLQMLADVMAMIRLHSVLAAPFDGLAVGPLFALVGASFLWPLVAAGKHQAH